MRPFLNNRMVGTLAAVCVAFTLPAKAETLSANCQYSDGSGPVRLDIDRSLSTVVFSELNTGVPPLTYRNATLPTYQDQGTTVSEEKHWVVVAGDKIWFGRTYKTPGSKFSYKYTLNLANSSLTEFMFGYHEDGGREVQAAPPVEADYMCQKVVPLSAG